MIVPSSDGNVGAFVGICSTTISMSQVAIFEEVSFQIDSSASTAKVGGLVSISGSGITIKDSFCRASFNSAVSPVKKLFRFKFYLITLNFLKRPINMAVLSV